jgi:hypothetical protein
MLHLIFPQIDRTIGLYIVAAFVVLFTAAAGKNQDQEKSEN